MTEAENGMDQDHGKYTNSNMHCHCHCLIPTHFISNNNLHITCVWKGHASKLQVEKKFHYTESNILAGNEKHIHQKQVKIIGSGFLV